MCHTAAARARVRSAYLSSALIFGDVSVVWTGVGAGRPASSTRRKRLIDFSARPAISIKIGEFLNPKKKRVAALTSLSPRTNRGKLIILRLLSVRAESFNISSLIRVESARGVFVSATGKGQSWLICRLRIVGYLECS